MIKNIVFDMGGVLADFNPGYFVEQYMPSHTAEERFLVRRELFRSVEWLRLDRGSITEEEALRSVCRRLPEGLHDMAARLMEGWTEFLRPDPAMKTLCGRLRAAGCSLYLLSNANLRFADHCQADNIPAIAHFKGQFISAQWGLLKPDEAIYRAFCAHFALVPSECFFVDDMPANIESAQRCGMEGFVFQGEMAGLEEALRAEGVEF